MALATKCPHCNTTFRVAADQLKLRGGIVRCGTCSQVFDGNAALVDLDAVAKKTAPQPEPEALIAPEPAPEPEPEFIQEAEPEPEPEQEPEPQPEPAPAAPAYVLDFDISLDTFPKQDGDPAPDETDSKAEAEPEPEPEPEPEAEPEPVAEPEPAPVIDEDENSELSLADVVDEPLDEASSDPSSAERDLELGPLPLLRESAAAPDLDETPSEPEFVTQTEEFDHDEPEFVRLAREKEDAVHRRRLIMGIGSLVLIVALLAQSVMSFGNVMVAKYPGLKPTIVAACALLRCKVELPSQIDALGIETSELQTLPNGNFVLTTLLRNESTLTQAWPHIELELKDASDKPQVRRVFTPAQYLPANVIPAKGFAARSEQPVKIYFELKQVTASGFHTEIFYP